MYISLDVLVRIAQIVLIGCGCAALLYLALVFKSLIATLNSATRTLDILQKDLEKLESPLQTVDEISNSVDELHGSAKEAAMSAISTFSAGMETLKDKFTKSKPAPVVEAEIIQETEVQPDFQPIRKEADEGTEKKTPGDSSVETTAKNTADLKGETHD